MLYSVALFVHILGALGLFMALGLEWAGLRQLRRAATAEQARAWLSAVAVLPRLYAPAATAILLSGLYMIATAWSWTVGWPGVALAALVLLAALGAALTGRRMAAIGRAVAAESGPVSPALRQRLHDPVLWTSVQTRLAIAVGIVFLMTIKPALGGALLAIGVAALLGLAATIPAWGRDRALDRAA
jgi:hypothetical protein